MAETGVISIVPTPARDADERGEIDAQGRKSDTELPEFLGEGGTAGHAGGKPRMSLASAYDASYIVTEVQAEKFKRNAIMVSIAWFFLVMTFLCSGLAQPYSFNYILNGRPEIVTAESSGMLSLCVSIQTACSVLTQVIWGRGGSWYGRQRMLVAMSTLLLVGVALGLFAHMFKLAELWILGGILTGFASAGFAQGQSYCADMSTSDNFAATTGFFSAMGMFGSVAGLVFVTAMGARLLGVLAAIVGFAFISVCMYMCLVPNVSPPPEKRTQGTAKEVGLALCVCSAGKLFLEMTSYTKCLTLVIFFGGASFGALRVWIFSYSILNFGFGIQSLGTLLLAWSFLGGVITLIGSRWIPAKLGANCVLWTQTLFSLVCSVGPAKEITLWIAIALGFGDAVSASFINTMYFGQLSGRRRGELAALQSLADKVGKLVGVLLITPVNVQWLKSLMLTGQGTAFTPPMVQLSFEVCAVTLYYLAQVCFRHQDKYGLFVLRTSEEEPDDRQTPTAAWDEEEGAGGR